MSARIVADQMPVRAKQRILVESWAPEYGAPVDADALSEPAAKVDVNVELPAADWKPLDPSGDDEATYSSIEFVDGVRRIDARVWITGEDGESRLGICASYAAGVACCERDAKIRAIQVRRALFARSGSPELQTRVGNYEPIAVAEDDIDSLVTALQRHLGKLEREVAASIDPDRGEDLKRLTVVDGPLSGQYAVPGAIGYIKSHRVGYLPEVTRDIVAQLNPGQRTPLFVTQTTWSRYSWYLRLPGGEGHPWAGVVRCEAPDDWPLPEVKRLADQTAAKLPRFASHAHQDTRAPQNLYPIAALERELRHRLGDAGLVYRALREAARA